MFIYLWLETKRKKIEDNIKFNRTTYLRKRKEYCMALLQLMKFDVVIVDFKADCLTRDLSLWVECPPRESF